MESNREIYLHNELWTNQKHLNFLNSMEAAFVETMLGNSGSALRLHRHIPDFSESTLDLQKGRRNKHKSSDIVEHRAKSQRPSDKITRRSVSSQPYDPAQDQVVPQIEASAETGRSHYDVPLAR